MLLYVFLIVMVVLMVWCALKLNEGIQAIKGASQRFTMLINMIVAMQPIKTPDKTFYSAKALSDMGEERRKLVLAAMDEEERKTAIEDLEHLGL